MWLHVGSWIRCHSYRRLSYSFPYSPNLSIDTLWQHGLPCYIIARIIVNKKRVKPNTYMEPGLYLRLCKFSLTQCMELNLRENAIQQVIGGWGWGGWDTMRLDRAQQRLLQAWCALEDGLHGCCIDWRYIIKNTSSSNTLNNRQGGRGLSSTRWISLSPRKAFMKH